MGQAAKWLLLIPAWLMIYAVGIGLGSAILCAGDGNCYRDMNLLIFGMIFCPFFLWFSVALGSARFLWGAVISAGLMDFYHIVL